MMHFQVEIEPIVDSESAYYRTSVYDVRFHKPNRPIRYVLDIYRSPTIESAISALAEVVALNGNR
jgi:hypothetical protein